LTALPDAAKAEHLTEALRRAGVLGNAAVLDVEVESARSTILSRIIRLRLNYDGDAADAPASIILKTGLDGSVGPGWFGGRQEAAFYAQVAATTPGTVVPRCYEARCDEATKTWHLLLEDLTDTHTIPTAWPLPPTRAQCERIIAARARFHAAWWDDTRLGVLVGVWQDAVVCEQRLRNWETRFAQFVDRLGDLLPSHRRVLYERLLRSAARLFARYDQRRNLTIVQGDAHVWNCFLPRDGGDDVRLFDWDAWHIDVAAADHANMIAMHWYPDRRRLLERPLLDHYHATLLAHGVRGYDRATLDEDYRLAVLWEIMTPVWQVTANIPPVIWWNNMERLLLAVDDLGCRDLLD
jgi:Ecdysteroid kinase-like family